MRNNMFSETKMKNFLERILQYLQKLIGGEKINVGITYKIPKKVEKLINKKFIKNHNNNITHCIWHHSTTEDNEITNNWRSIDVYHRSFRRNWTTIIRPVSDENFIKELNAGKHNDYLKIHNSWYTKDEVEDFYKVAERLTGKKLKIGQYFSRYGKNTYIETPWRKIGYTIGIERENEKLVVKYGRGLKERQAHCYQEGMNTKSIGILVVGNYDKTEPDGELWRFCVKVAREINKEFPEIKHKGHREIKGVHKSCPGSKFNMDQFRSDIQDNNGRMSYK